jgi:NitT/TauT family transport system permease protein
VSAAKRIPGVALPPLALGILLIGLWQVVVDAFAIKSWILSSPSEIWRALTSLFSGVVTATTHTGLNAIVGLATGVVLAVILAALCTRLRLLGHAVTPVAGALAAVPIVCTAPIFLFMYGLTSPTPRRAVVAIAAFVPVYLNTIRGLSEVSSVHDDLMRSLAATRTDVLRVVRFPGALPHFCTGLRIAASLAVISAVVSEYFGGLQNGLGYFISDQAHNTNYPAAWAAVLAAVVLGLLFFAGAVLIERVLLERRAATASSYR